MDQQVIAPNIVEIVVVDVLQHVLGNIGIEVHVPLHRNVVVGVVDVLLVGMIVRTCL